MYHNSVTCALLVLLASSSARAAPTDSQLHRRQTSSGSSTPGAIGPQIWIPLVILAILIVAGLSVACYSRNFGRWSNWGGSVAQAAAAAAGTTPANARELTADQLAGTTANNTTANASGGTGRARRPRRTRRTPSQISTHSLPAYMKEPGDQEIVIGRGQDDLEDMPIPITVTMPMVDENIADTPDGSFDATRPSSEYVAMPESPTDEPLLQHGEHESEQHLTATHDDSATRRSFDSAISSDNSHVNYTDDAPPYEAIPLNSSADSPTSSLPSNPAHAAGASGGQAPQPQTHGEGVGAGSTRRRSVFMSIFNPRNSRMAPPPVPSNAGSPEPRPSGHTREGSGPSIVSLAPSERDPRPRSRVRHRPSHSGSGSMFSLLSRTRSNGNLAADRLTSPSMISLNSISSPLSHTLVRTEFAYPKTGPTPEQLKFISSRDNVARFGVPYGSDAIAFASTSRVNLEPPPGFEEVATTSGTSPLAAEERDESPDLTMSEESNDVEATAAGNGTHVASSESSSQAQAQNTEVPTSTSNSIEGLPPTSDPLEAQFSVPSASLPSITTSPSEPSHPAPLSPPPSASTTSPAPSNPPPSAFKGGFNTGSLPTRAASRASSYMTFETADESMNASEPPTPGASRYDLADDAYESAVETPVDGSVPVTPRLESRHLHEPTDTTITPGR
ncbi:hypothetical protein C2E23DRAFT_858315 [Lenzites betulinus]|nr:hypothetical protein C2E23DRAFT_858315 [Lenzites betulinus]